MRLTLCDDASHDAQLPESRDGLMPRIGPCLDQIGPAQEGARPVAFARLVVFAKFVIVDGAVRLVQRIGAAGASIVCQSGGNRQARARQEERPAMGTVTIEYRRPPVCRSRSEEVCESSDGAGGCACSGRDYARRREGRGVGNAQERGANRWHCSGTVSMVQGSQVQRARRATAREEWRRSTNVQWLGHRSQRAELGETKRARAAMTMVQRACGFEHSIRARVGWVRGDPSPRLYF